MFYFYGIGFKCYCLKLYVYTLYMFYVLAQGQKHAETGFAMSNVTFGVRSKLKHWSIYAVTELDHLCICCSNNLHVPYGTQCRM